MWKLDLDAIKSKAKLPRIGLPDLQDPRTRVFLVAGGALALLVVVALSYGFWYTSQPSFCSNCHVVKQDHLSWKNSVHAEVSCNTCHFPGTFGVFKQKASLVRETFVYFTGAYQKPLNINSQLSKKIDDEGCLKCHTPKRIVTPRRTLVMNHNIHLEKGVNCTTCHNRVGHPGLQGYRSYISMDGCFRCHGLSKTAIAPGKCSACHPKTFDLVPVSHKTGTWQVPDHGKTAKQDISVCTVCHQKTYCRGCHGVEVPHSDKFVKDDHGAIGRKNPAVCQKCHRQKDFCNSCHHKGYQGPPGGWVPTHKAVVAQVGPAYCFNCHGPTYCATCHVRS